MGFRPGCVAVIAFLLMAASANAQDLLRRLEKGEAVDEWRRLPPEKQVALLREGLQVGDPKIRYLAARILDPHCLSLEEVRLQAAVLVSHAEWLKDPDAATPKWADRNTLPIGSPDIPRLWRTAAAAADLPGAREQLVYYHRALLPEHIPVLVGQLERAGPEVFRAAADNLRLVADYTSKHRDVAARGFLYVLERVSRERSKQARPRAEDVTLDPKSKAAFIVLAKAAWAPDRGTRYGVKIRPPHAWLVRWAREIAWKKEDVPFLSRILWRSDLPIAEEWATRRLGKLEVRETLLELAEGEDSLAGPGAAELARLGEPARFLQLLSGEDVWEPIGALAWYATPVEARRRRLGTILQGYVASDLMPLARYELEAGHEVRIREEDLAWIAENLSKIDADPVQIAAYFGQVHPEGLTAEIARGLARRLRSVENEPDYARQILAPLEVANRAALVELLDHWAAQGRSWALHYLARLGEARHVPAMLAASSEIPAWVLGRVRDRRVERHLRARLEEGDTWAVEPLAIYYGLPETLRFVLKGSDEEIRLVLKRDPVAAALDAVRVDPKPWHVARLGLAQDGRATAFLRRLREQHHRGRYWAATAGLALAGDAAAAAEFGALIKEGRIWLLDRILDHQVLTLGLRPEWIDFWLSRINTNCCLSYMAIDVLSQVYPTFPVEHDRILDYACKERFAREWLASYAFRHSRLLDGFLPVGE
jgi:hypothetical protein